MAAAGVRIVAEPLAAEAAVHIAVVEAVVAVVAAVEADRTAAEAEAAVVVVTTDKKPRFLCHQVPCAGC